MASAWNRLFPPQPEWTIDEVPDQSGKVFLMTGGIYGIGLATAKVLLSRNAKVYITSPNEEKARHAMDELRRVSEAIHILHMDLSNLHSIRNAAHEFLRRERCLHALINNAEVSDPSITLLTRQKYDLQFGVHVLAHFYLTHLLLPLLLSTAKSSGSPSRVVNLSATMSLTGRIDYTTLMDGPVRRRCRTADLCRQSRLATLLMTLELAEQYGEQGIVSVAVDPGHTHSSSLGIMMSITDIFAHSVSRALLTPLFAITSSKVANLNGKLLVPWARVGQIPASITEHRAQETLWDWLEAQTDCFDRLADQLSSESSWRCGVTALQTTTMYSFNTDLV